MAQSQFQSAYLKEDERILINIDKPGLKVNRV